MKLNKTEQTTLTSKELNSYLPLIHKIVNQLYNNLSSRQKEIFERDELVGYGYEGLAKAYVNYDEGRSKMTFRQYAAYSIRNTCLNGINEDSRTIKISFYNQKQMKDNQLSTIITRSIESFNTDSDSDNSDRLIGLADDEVNFDNPMEYMLNLVRAKFNKDIYDIFCRYYGFTDDDNVKGKDLSKMYGLSNASISIKLKKVVDYIKTNKELVDLLRDCL